MYLIIGLGNPGEKYSKTRHNLGYLVVEKIIKNISGQSLSHKEKLKAEVGKYKTDFGEIIIARPTTYMNLSGVAVNKIKNYYKVEVEDIIVISDDCNIEIGSIRVRMGGSDGGHNGLKSIIETVGPGFWRFRLGIGTNQNMPLEKYVLSDIPHKDKKKYEEMVDKTADLLLESISQNSLENISI